MTYADKLKSPFWQRKRLEIFQRDNWTCQRCLATHNELQVHHFFYLSGRKSWEYPNEALVTTCDLCHGHMSKGEEHGDGVSLKDLVIKHGLKHVVFWLLRATVHLDREQKVPDGTNLRKYLGLLSIK